MGANPDSTADHVSRIASYVLRLICYAFLLTLAFLCLHPLPALVYADGPTFPVRRIFGTGTDWTEGVAVGDVDGDGDLDLVVGNDGQQNSVYLNDGTGYFGQTRPFGTGLDETYDVAVGDVNGDGYLDIVAANAPWTSGQSAVYVNDGTGHFDWPGAVRNFGTGADSLTSVAVGDMNGDGALDIVVGSYSHQDYVYLNNGAGDFPYTDVYTRSFGGNSTASVAVGDMDGDGDLDIVAGTGNQNAIYLNDGEANFVPRIFDPSGWDTQSVAVGDMNGDGALDIIVGNYGNESVVLFLNEGGGHFGAGEVLDTDLITVGMAVGDVDGDGDLDLLAGTSGRNAVFVNDGEGNLAIEWPFDLGTSWTRCVAMADVDGDGDPDIVIGNSEKRNTIYLNDGGGSFTAVRDLDVGNVAVGDMDGDDHLDIVTANLNEQNAVYLNDGAGHFPGTSVYTRPFGTGSDSAGGLAVGDMDGDGHLDIVVGNSSWSGDRQNVVYLNDGAGSFPNTSVYTRPFGTGSDRTVRVLTGDLDNDGDLDIVAGNLGQNAVYLNDGTGTFPNTSVYTRPFGTGSDWTESVALGDIDGDGDLDIVVGNSAYSWMSEPGRHVVYLNDGAGSFHTGPFSCGTTPGVRCFGTGWTWDGTGSVAVGDVDSDGDMDIVVGSAYYPDGDQNVIYLNDGAGHFHIGPVVCDVTPGVRCFGIGWDGTESVALGDINGDGSLDIVAGNILGVGSGPNAVYLNDETGSFGIARSLGAESDGAWSVAVGDIDSDGDLDFITDRAVYVNGLSGVAQMADNSPSISVIRPGLARNAGFFSTPEVLDQRDISIPYTLFDAEGNMAGHVAASYSLDGGGRWLTATATGDTLTQNLALGAALAFDGQDDWVETADFDIENDFTISFWTNPYTTTDGQAFIGKHNSIGSNLVVFVFYDGGYHLNIRDTGYTGGTKTTGWQHLAVVGDEDGGTTHVTVYRNGEVLWQHDFSAVVGDVSGGRAWAIGQEWDVPSLQSDFFDGSIDEVRIWNVARTQMEIKADMYRELEGDEPGLAAYWPFDEGAGVQVFDQSANGRNGLLGGGVAEQRPTWVGGRFATHVYTWDTFASGLFGQSDNVVFRLVAYPHPSASASPGTYRYFSGTSGPYQRPYASATTFPFRVRGTQVRVYSEAAAPGNEVGGALVYRLPVDQSAGGSLVADSAGTPFRTDHNGYLQGRGEIGLGDRLLALLPITWTESCTLYYTSGTPTEVGLDTFSVVSPGVQILTVSADNPLYLFNLDVSLEWDAHNDDLFLEKLEYDLQRAAEYLYDYADGQAGLGEVYVFHDAENWQTAHARVYANNRLRPSATLGGYVGGTVTDTLVPTITYEAGQIRMPATWNRYGDPGGSVGEDWPRTLAHEFGHYYLFLDDHYLGLDEEGQVISIYTCTHTAMTDPYRYSEYRDQADWLPACEDTIANHLTGRSDWATIELFYPELSGPDTRGYNDGPTLMPFNFTAITVFDPLTPTETLPDPTFYFLTEGGQRVQPGEGTRGFLLKDETWLLDVGEPVIDHILARGAKAGDRLCVFDAADDRLGCETIQRGDDQMVLYGFPDWHPEIVVTPVATDVISVAVHAAESLPLQGRIFSIDGPATEVFDFTETVSGTYETTMGSEDVLLLEGFVQIWVNEAAPRREMITDYSVGASPGLMRGHGGLMRGHGGLMRGHGGLMRGHGGLMRGHGAPILSGDGQVTIYTPDPTIPEGEFLTIQAATGVPELPAGRVQIGQAYRIAATEGITNLEESSISFQYLGGAVPAGMEEDITIYHWDEDEAEWDILATALNPEDNFASARVEGSGLYALLTAFRIPLVAPGWNLFSYPLRDSQTVSAALASIEGEYGIVYGYDAAQLTWEAWDVYGVGVPGYVNDLKELVFGRGYWISVTQAITMYIGGSGGQSELSVASLPPQVPATYYGRVLGGIGPGETVRAWVDGNLCGQGQTMVADNRVVYAINVLAEEGGLVGCGAVGREITFQVGSVMMYQTAVWDDSRLWEVWLSESAMPFEVYLPSVLRGD
jgi:hypothetical protein